MLAVLRHHAAALPMPFSLAPPATEGRFHYDEAVQALNFERAAADFTAFLALLSDERAAEQPRALAGQGLGADRLLPGFATAHRNPLLPPEIAPRMWISNRAKVATHNDELENIACLVAGRRRFTFFPPETIGDQWFHHVEALDPVNTLVNYWWDPARQDLGSPWDALLHGMIALRGLPADQRRAWKHAFDHYVLLENGNPAAHLPEAARGILADADHGAIAELQSALRHNLDPRCRERRGPLA